VFVFSLDERKMASKQDIQVASLAAGFTLGFGFLTVWKAIQHTARNRRPWRSAYIYMIWGEIVANLAIGIIGWVFLDGLLSPTLVLPTAELTSCMMIKANI
jgi:hypothetical protein